jgi:valyl-tRNA synthetase
VPPLPHRPVGRRGGVRRRSPVTSGTSEGIPWPRGSRRCGGGHHPAGDHAGRHRRGGEPQRRALQAPRRQDLHPPPYEPGDPHRGRRVRGHRSSAPAAVKMTPAHDPNDFEVGLRHNLEIIRVIDDNGTINDLGGKYAGHGPLRVPQGHRQGPGGAGLPHRQDRGLFPQRGHLLPLRTDDRGARSSPSPVVCEDGASGQGGHAGGEGGAGPSSSPSVSQRPTTNWMDNVHDWCISRQLWWGHQIPAWYCDDCGHINVSRERPHPSAKTASTQILTREEDVLDTWFSSALWPFSTLGWPERSAKDFQYFYPTDVLVTGYDIIFFWVARMIFSGMRAHEGGPPSTPCSSTAWCGTTRAARCPSPWATASTPWRWPSKYGADALRFNLITGNSPPATTCASYTEKLRGHAQLRQ